MPVTPDAAGASPLHLAVALDGAGWHPAAVFDEGADAVEVVRRLWDSWEDDAVIRDVPAEAVEYARHVRRQQVSPQTAILPLEQVWNTDLSSFDPEGPLPPFDPDPEADSIIKGRSRQHDDKVATARKWRAIAEEKKLSIRDLIIEVTGRQVFTGTPSAVAESINKSVQDDACDGFILVPHLIPAGLDEFAARVVPLLQERGVLRSSYAEGTTLRDRMGLGPARPAASWAAARKEPVNA